MGRSKEASKGTYKETQKAKKQEDDHGNQTTRKANKEVKQTRMNG
jgi:hypothetical protein